MKRTIFAAGVAIACLTATAAAEPVSLKPGEWTYTMTMTVPNSGMAPVTESESDCLGEWESNLEPQALAQEFAGGAECTATNVVQSSNKVSFDMSCPGQALNKAKITLDHAYTSFTMDGDITLDLGNGQTIASDLVVDANYVGVCTK